MTKSTILHELSPEQITSLFEGIKKELAEIKANFQPKQPIEFLTRNEATEMLKCDLSTLWLWTKKGKLTSYGIGNRTYYKRSEIEAALICLNNKKTAENE